MRFGGQALLALAFASVSFVGVAHAGDAAVAADLRAVGPWSDRLFFFAGTGVARDSAFFWAGFVGAPNGLLSEDGPRLRVMVGHGRYRYRTAAVASGTNEADVSNGELLLGFHRAFGSVGITAYLGAHVEDQRLARPDPGNFAAGIAVGAKIAMEIFARPDPLWVVSASASASTVHRAYHARAAIARELRSGFSLGVEAALHGDARYFEPRAGLLTSASHGRTVLTLAGGVLSNSDSGSGAYATLSLYAPY